MQIGSLCTSNYHTVIIYCSVEIKVFGLIHSFVKLAVVLVKR